MNAHVLRVSPGSSLAHPADIAEQLELVERRLMQVVSSEVETASDLSCYLLTAGGKRIRPTLVVLSALAAGGQPSDPGMIDVATATELVHTASLVHDDVVDETSERRGVITASGKWGNKVSVLGGDFLLAKAFLLLAQIADSEVLSIFSRTAVAMTESELLQARSEGNLASWQANYEQIIRGKTASFLGGCCECGAVIAGAGPSSRQAFQGYGMELGRAFQITDDLLDITGDPAETGKDIGTDLMHGKFTWPVLASLDMATGSSHDRLVALLGKGFLQAKEAAEVAEIAISCGAVDASRQLARQCAARACESVAGLAENEHTAALEALAYSVATRDS